MNYEGELGGSSLNVAKPTILYEVCHTQDEMKPSSSKFLLSLWEMLSDPSSRGDVSWSEDGSYFVITNARRFSEKVLPVYFKHNNLTSFTRQLYNYGFSRISPLMKPDFLRMLGQRPHAKTEFLAFKHANFHRDHPEFLTNVRKRQQRPEGVSMWQTIFQINSKLDSICDRLNDLGHRVNVLEAKQATTEKRYSGLWRIFNYAISTALMSRGEGMTNKQPAMLKFNPRLKLAQSNEDLNLPPSMKKHRLDDIQTASLNGQTYLRVPSDDIPLVRRAMLAYQPSTNEPSKCSLTYQVGQNQSQENTATDETGCNALVIRNPGYTLTDDSVNIPENAYEHASMPSVTDVLPNGNNLFSNGNESTNEVGNIKSNGSTPFQRVPQESTGVSSLGNLSSSESKYDSVLSKWPVDNSTNNFDFGSSVDDPFLGMTDLFGLPLNMDEMHTPKFPLDFEKNDASKGDMTEPLFSENVSQTDASANHHSTGSSRLCTTADMLGGQLSASSSSQTLFEQDFLADSHANFETARIARGSTPVTSLRSGSSAQDYVTQSHYSDFNGKAPAYDPTEGSLTADVPLATTGNDQLVMLQAPVEKNQNTAANPPNGRLFRLSIKPVKK
uniref:HSF-type DNA-binding domain-containing protein n=1 Tax=Trichuris muris TaxID=70415 RepID=A0A5S6PZH9_TRIMR